MAGLIQSLAQAIPPHLINEVRDELVTGWNHRTVALKHQAKMLGAFHKSHESKPIDGMGKLIAQIPADAYHYWGQRLSYDCWKDKQFVQEFMRDNPEVAVQNYAKKTAVGGHKGLFDASGYLIK
jgi:hypothetical protein